MARARSPARDKAFEIYKKSKGKKKLKDIAAELGVADTQVRKWKNQDKWEELINGSVPIAKGNVTNQKKMNRAQPIPSLDELIEDISMSEKQRLFCIFYVKSFNATQSAIKAGYAPDSAHVRGSELVRNSKVAEEIRRIKGEMRQGVFIDAMDILDKYIKIAFADITDFVTYGKKEVPLIGAFGPIKDEDGNALNHEINYIDFKESSMVDGSIISEVKQGKDGISVKLADKMKALEKLSLYFDLFPDKFKRDLEEEKLKIAHHKVFGAEEEEYEDDGFIEALNGKVEEIWSDEDEA
jgi:phage terminase small subunit